MTKLILIEGIPGSGKTTFAKKIAERYRNIGQQVNLYLEGPGHPVDLGWYACFTVLQYNELLNTCNLYRNDIERVAIIDGGYVLIPFSLIQTDDENLSKQWNDFDVYNGSKRIADDIALRLLCNRWRIFCEQEKIQIQSIELFGNFSF